MNKRRRYTKDTGGQPGVTGEQPGVTGEVSGILALANMNDLGKLEIPTSGVTPEVTSKVFHLLHELIELCIDSYMTKEQTAERLQGCNNIPSSITLQLWTSMEMENPEFFREYNIRLILIRQIMQFNKLLEKMDELIVAQAGQNEAPIGSLFQSVGDNSLVNGSSGRTEEGTDVSGLNGSTPPSDDADILIDDILL